MKLAKQGAAAGHPGMFWDGEKWVSSQGGATYSNGVFYANGGPVFPPLGTGATIFANGGPTASFYIDGNGYPTPFAMAPGSGKGGGMLQDLPTHMQTGGVTQDGEFISPFAMWPGSGTGGGMLEDLPTHMKKGGHHKGSGGKKKLTPQQMQMMMASMGQQGMPPGGGGMPMMPPGGGAGQMMAPQGMMPQGQPMMDPSQGGQQPMMPGMASGGIHIKKSHEGRFTAYKKRTGKTTEEALHSKDPHVRQMANFARNAAKWHHEMGGPVTQGGNMVHDNEMYAYGGQFHPLARFMADGGDTDPVSPDSPMGGGMQLPANNDSTQNAWTPTQSNYDPSTDPNNPVNNPGPMPKQGGYAAAQGPVYDTTGTTDAQDQNMQPQDTGQTGPEHKNNGWNKFYTGAKIGFGTLGAGLAIASAYNNISDERRMAGYRRSLGTSDNIAKVNQPGSKGDWDQYGNFRPNQNTPVRPGMYYPMGSNAPVSQYGGTFAMGGKYSQDGGVYHAGQEMEMDDAEIARLRKMGYKIDML